jgi:hypothetical protein
MAKKKASKRAVVGAKKKRRPRPMPAAGTSCLKNKKR